MILKFFDVLLKFDLSSAGFLNFPQNSAPSLIGPVLIIGDCVYAFKCAIFIQMRTCVVTSYEDVAHLE